MMRAVVSLLLGLLVMPLSTGAAQARTADSTPSYDVTATLDRQGRLAVTETIGYAFGSGTHHGIERTIPTRPAGQGGTFVDQVDARSPDGAPAVWTVDRTGSATTIRIGDPGQAVSGRHTYVLKYVLGGAAARDGKTTRVSWNALGTGWRTPIDRATVRLITPARPSGVRCYAGPEGSHQACAGERTTDTGLGVGANALDVGEGITVTAGFPGNEVTADPLTGDRQRVTAEEPKPRGTHPAAADGPSSTDKIVWGVILGGLLIGAVVIGLASRGVSRGGGGSSYRGGGYRGGGSGGGGGVGGGAGGGGGGGW